MTTRTVRHVYVAPDAEIWREVAELAHAFLESLPHGWLAHTTGDIGALNEFYIKYRKAKFPTS